MFQRKALNGFKNNTLWQTVTRCSPKRALPQKSAQAFQSLAGETKPWSGREQSKGV